MSVAMKRLFPRGIVSFMGFSQTITVLFTGLSILGFVVVNMIAGLLMGTWPDADACAAGGLRNGAGAWLCEGPGYPLFYPPFWIMLLPAVLMAISSIISIPLPSKVGARNTISRFVLWVICVVAALQTLVGAVAYGGYLNWMLVPAVWLWAIPIVLFLLRGLLGTMKLVPRSWQ